MPTIQQLVRKEGKLWWRRVNHPHWTLVLKDVAFAYVFTLRLRRNLTLQCVSKGEYV